MTSISLIVWQQNEKFWFVFTFTRFLSNTTESRSAAEGESSASRTAKDSKGASTASTGRRPGDRSLKLTDLEEIDHPSDADYDDDDEEEEGAEEATDGADTGKGSNKKRNIEIVGKAKGPVTAAERARLLRKKQRDAAIVTRMRRFVKKRKKKSRVVGSSSEDDDVMEEAVDDSEVDDHEGDEVSSIFIESRRSSPQSFSHYLWWFYSLYGDTFFILSRVVK